MMSQTRHYQNAPITEAIIDLRVESASRLSADTLESVGEGERDLYPDRKPILMGTGYLQWGEQVSAAASSSPLGTRFVSTDGRVVWQARVDGFTISRLAPYDRWESFRDEARRLWTIYRAQLQSPTVQRIAVRYINRFDIPCGRLKLKEYFRTYPEVSPELPDEPAGLLLHLRIPQRDMLGEVLINQAIVPPASENVRSVVLDLDLYRAESVPDEEGPLWELFEELHIRKNALFEACITDRARELIQ
jgi:uncharacterized protein (TIGR04255 family)